MALLSNKKMLSCIIGKEKRIDHMLTKYKNMKGMFSYILNLWPDPRQLQPEPGSWSDFVLSLLFYIFYSSYCTSFFFSFVFCFFVGDGDRSGDDEGLHISDFFFLCFYEYACGKNCRSTPSKKKRTWVP